MGSFLGDAELEFNEEGRLIETDESADSDMLSDEEDDNEEEEDEEEVRRLRLLFFLLSRLRLRLLCLRCDASFCVDDVLACLVLELFVVANMPVVVAAVPEETVTVEVEDLATRLRSSDVEG